MPLQSLHDVVLIPSINMGMRETNPWLDSIRKATTFHKPSSLGPNECLLPHNKTFRSELFPQLFHSVTICVVVSDRGTRIILLQANNG